MTTTVTQNPANAGELPGNAGELIEQWLAARLSAAALTWLQQRLPRVGQQASRRELYITLGMIPRRLGQQPLALDARSLAQASTIRQGWIPSDWRVDTAARARVLIAVANADQDGFPAIFSDLCQGADLHESIALYQSTAVFPESVALEAQLGEGLRSNIRAVFEAIAHRNPRPRELFDTHRWNHMVLKALFIDSALWPIQGLDERANPELARVLCDYAHERWAAGRTVSHELWRCVGPFAQGSMIDDLARASQLPDHHQRQAALLALRSCPDPRADIIVRAFPEECHQMASGALTWESLTLVTDQQSAAALSRTPAA